MDFVYTVQSTLGVCLPVHYNLGSDLMRTRAKCGREKNDRINKE